MVVFAKTSFKTLFGAAFLIFLEYPYSSKRIVWSRKIVPDLNIIHLVNRVKPEIEKREEKEFELFEPVSYISQLSAGTNYWNKVRHDDGFMHVKIFEPLPHMDQPPFLREYQLGKTLTTAW